MSVISEPVIELVLPFVASVLCGLPDCPTPPPPYVIVYTVPRLNDKAVSDEPPPPEVSEA